LDDFIKWAKLEPSPNKTREMTVDADEFIRRFLLHVLPKGFMKIRYFGFLANKNKKKAIPISNYIGSS